MADQFLKMTKCLHEDHISHGDLQDGNLLVTNHLSQLIIKLIDYDTLYIAGFKGIERQIVGVSGYQHPNRSMKKVIELQWDYFSELVIYLSLCVYSERSQIWKPGQEKALLFTKADFDDTKHTVAFTALNSMSIKVRRLADILVDFCCESELNHLQLIEKVISNIQRGDSYGKF